MEPQKKDIEFWLFNQDNLKRVCQLLCEVWNDLCRENGWPHRKSWQEMLRERKAIRSLARQYALENSDEETKTALRWILSRWNWQKTPAPLNMLTSKTQWNCYRMVLAREKEESSIVVQEKQSSIREWARLEMLNRVRSGDTPIMATKETLDFALILGKLNGMNTKEKLSFFNFCEEFEEELTNNIRLK